MVDVFARTKLRGCGTVKAAASSLLNISWRLGGPCTCLEPCASSPWSIHGLIWEILSDGVSVVPSDVHTVLIHHALAPLSSKVTGSCASRPTPKEVL